MSSPPSSFTFVADLGVCGLVGFAADVLGIGSTLFTDSGLGVENSREVEPETEAGFFKRGSAVAALAIDRIGESA